MVNNDVGSADTFVKIKYLMKSEFYQNIYRAYKYWTIIIIGLGSYG